MLCNYLGLSIKTGEACCGYKMSKKYHMSDEYFDGVMDRGRFSHSNVPSSNSIRDISSSALVVHRRCMLLTVTALQKFPFFPGCYKNIGLPYEFFTLPYH